ncbi:MAG: hypothetical protein HY272_08810 [Gammaproteobacteria bacterium]|nr:hypothetical protein [Gammaproteobacteria bacterium]
MNSKLDGKALHGQAAAMPDSRLKYFGRQIPIHRAIHNYHFPRSRLKTVFFLPLVFTLLSWPALKLVAISWGYFFDFWITKLGVVGSVSSGTYGPAWLNLEMPYLNISASAPDASVWWGMIFVIVFTVGASSVIPDRYLPLRYFIRLCALIQFSSLIFFVLSPGAFHYTLQDHLMGFETTAIFLMMVLPWIHALIYYIFEFSLSKKILFTLISLLLCSLIAPFLMMIHAYLIYKYSLMLLPLLYFIFGFLFLIMACISIYGWAMSWNSGQRIS